VRTGLIPVVAVIAVTAFASGKAEAQFAPPGARAQPSASGNIIAPRQATSRRMTLAEQQRQWATTAARAAMTKINFLPRTATVNASVQQAVTAFAPVNSFATGYARDWTPDDCEQSIRKAERKYGLPPYLLAAIALTESGKDGRPSPVAMNIGGRSYYASDTRDMEDTVFRNGGETASIDIGCMQVNLRWHSARFKDWRSLLVPNYNAGYAALHLTELYRKYGSWNAAVGAYHSRTPWKSANYACLVSRRWSQIFGSVRPGCGADIEAMARYMYQTQRG
jgi:soluble lytic murein transglycosylase-like protein